MNYLTNSLFLLFTIFCFWSPSSVDALDALARDKCRDLHHVDVDGNSAYSNNNCLLRCVIHGTANDHFMNEGFPCPLAEAGVCKSGQCVPKTPVTPTSPPQPPVKLGSLNIQIISAQFAKTDDLKTPYVNVCLMNSTTHQTLPLQDKTTCNALCNANLYGNPNPKWNSICTGLFVEHAGVYFEVKDVPGMHTGGGTSVFLGGVALTVPQLLSHGDNSKELHLQLTGSTLNSGYINAKITWTVVKRS